MAGHSQLDLGAGGRAAPHLEGPANPFSTLPHPRDSPVPVRPRLQHPWIHAAAIVANEQA